MTLEPICECGAPLPCGDGPLRCTACGRDPGAIVARPEPAPESRITDEPPEPDDDTPLTGGDWARDVSLPSAGLSSPAVIFLAVFLCGPMAGVLLMSRNDGVLRRRWRGWAALLAGALLCVLEGAVYYRVAPESDMRFTGFDVAVCLVNIVLLTAVAAVLHGKEARARKGAGASAVVGRALLGLALGWALISGGAYGAWWLTSDPPDAVVDVAPAKQVWHTKRCQAAEARALGKLLLDEQVFGGPDAPREQVVRLDREGDVYVVSFWTDAAPDAEARDYYAGLARRLSEQVFGGARVLIRMLDLNGNVRTTADSEVGKRLRDGQKRADE